MLRTSPLSTPTHCHAYQKSPRGWHCTAPHQQFVQYCCYNSHCSDGYLSPHEYAVVVPARQAYSHCASVGNTYAQPAGILPASCAFKRVRNFWISSQDTFSTGRSALFRQLARRGTQPIRIPRHHRLVLGLGNFVFTQIKALRQRDIVFRCGHPILAPS